MIARAIVLFFMFAFPIYLAVQMVAERRLTKEQAAKVVKTTGLILISATMSGMVLLFIMLADKLI